MSADELPDDAVPPGEAGPDEAGPDAVRDALRRARAAAAARGLAASQSRGGTGSGGAIARRRRADAATRSGARPDERDPQLLGGLIERLVAERGWQVPLSIGGVMGRWEEIVGPEVAAHCRPETFTEGVLTVHADSTAWATQMRLLTPALMRRLAEEVGERIVTKIVVRGPAGPSWRRGLRRVSGGRGPRDTYG